MGKNIKIALVVCTYQRPESLVDLMNSVSLQKRLPDEILIIDASLDNASEEALEGFEFDNFYYHRVDAAHRGLTKQRNYGLSKLSPEIEVVSFVDDDTVLFDDYFQRMHQVFSSHPEVTGLGGVQVNGNRWEPKQPNKNYPAWKYYQWGNFVLKEDFRNRIRNLLRLHANEAPGVLPGFSHGRTCSYPLGTGLYEVDLLIGMSFAFRRKVFQELKFSSFFEGYGLYEDADYSLRAQKFGKNMIDTHLKLYHYHHPSGRPNQFKYGMMVVRNGWHIWRLKNPNPSLGERVKWHLITLLLAKIRLLNMFQGHHVQQAVSEYFGRMWAWLTFPLIKKTT